MERPRQIHGNILRIRQREIRRYLADLRRSERRSGFPPPVENSVAEKPRERDRHNSQDAAEDSSAIRVRPPERARNSHAQQNQRESEDRQVCPRNISRHRKTREKKRITDRAGERQNKSDPNVRIPRSLHGCKPPQERATSV